VDSGSEADASNMELEQMCQVHHIDFIKRKRANGMAVPIAQSNKFLVYKRLLCE